MLSSRNGASSSSGNAASQDNKEGGDKATIEDHKEDYNFGKLDRAFVRSNREKHEANSDSSGEQSDYSTSNYADHGNYDTGKNKKEKNEVKKVPNNEMKK